MPVHRFVVQLFLCFSLLLAPAFARGTPDNFADLAERLLPTVVNIATTQTLKSGKKPQIDLPPGSPLEDLLKNFFNNDGKPRRISSVGSGFIIDPRGYIVTNNHVIKGADKIAVTLNDGETLSAELIGTDERTDLALLKVRPKKPLPATHFGNSDKARIGEWVIAIGNPYGLGSTVTAGIISARNRDIDSGPYDDFLQTDAPINKGNSGGPLFNMAGQVIGINSAIFSPTGGSIGIGFAIPSNMAGQVVDQLRRYGKVHRGWVGMNIKPNGRFGARVTRITSQGPADRAGIRIGDVVLNYDGHTISDSRALARLAAATPAGHTVNVMVERGGKRLTLHLRVAPFK